jgi:hypothetical protein
MSDVSLVLGSSW